ncbi:hypothetical protein [Arsenophonus endosymbiont of Bemisia tabaci]|uniref:hypothetical protein n=1 Tax=Arsenophonus endosymbiont of Bemisia tabaci TaxID=536059 RepID=UPI001EE270E8|nr:hypothetical protein [Arsenophonus endosymbiont of Bemisia tabaci]
MGKSTPDAGSGIANIPTPIVVPATIKILPSVRFFRSDPEPYSAKFNLGAE